MGSGLGLGLGSGLPTILSRNVQQGVALGIPLIDIDLVVVEKRFQHVVSARSGFSRKGGEARESDGRRTSKPVVACQAPLIVATHR